MNGLLNYISIGVKGKAIKTVDFKMMKMHTVTLLQIVKMVIDSAYFIVQT